MGDIMKEKSIWLDTIEMNKFPTLSSDLSVDILVIGGGITGILCAYEAQKRGYNVAVLEMDRISSKTTKDTTAFITAQHELLYQDILKKKGFKKAKEYLDINLKAIQKYKELSLEYDFDFQECSSFLYDSNELNIIRKEKATLETLGENPIIEVKCPLNVAFYEAIGLEEQATINPLKLINELSKVLKIYEMTKVIKVNNKYCITENKYKVYFKNLIIATHYPIYNKKGLYFTRLTQRRSYVVAIELDKSNNNLFSDTYCGLSKYSLYFRTYNDYLIIGGNDRDTKDECLEDFKKRIEKLIINDKIKYSWSGQDCISIDQIPYIGRHNRLDKNIYVATGFNFWGFTWAMASSFILMDLIEKGIKCELTDPRRIAINKELLSNLKTSIKHLVTFKKPRCKHLGCALNYNKLENTWECPCHGSRYDEYGNVIDGPSLKNIKINRYEKR